MVYAANHAAFWEQRPRFESSWDYAVPELAQASWRVALDHEFAGSNPVGTTCGDELTRHSASHEEQYWVKSRSQEE